MSDLLDVKQKVQEGIEWRGTIQVQLDDEEEHELSIRQLRDPELREVLDLIDRDELEELSGDLPEDEIEEMRELQRRDAELSEDEQERLEELRDHLEEEAGDVLDVLSEETFTGIRRCAKHAIEPDGEDLEEAFKNRASAIEREYGYQVKHPEDVKPALQDEIDEMVDDATNFASINLGIQCLLETVGEEGN